MRLSLEKNKLILPVTTALLFSGSYVAARLTTVDLPPLTTSLLRYLCALLFLLIFLIQKQRPSLRVENKDRIWFFLLGATGIVGYHYFFLLSLQHTEIANTAIINATSPVLTGILAALFLRERLEFRNYLGVGLAFFGVLVLLSRGSPVNLLRMRVNPGDGLMLLAVLSWVTYGLIAKRLIDHYPGFTIVFHATIVGTLLLFLLSLTEHPIAAIRSASVTSWLSVLYMGICASGAGYLLYTLSLDRIGLTRTSSVVYSLVPILVACWAFLFFSQPITLWMMASMGLIIFGLQLILKLKR